MAPCIEPAKPRKALQAHARVIAASDPLAAGYHVSDTAAKAVIVEAAQDATDEGDRPLYDDISLVAHMLSIGGPNAAAALPLIQQMVDVKRFSVRRWDAFGGQEHVDTGSQTVESLVHPMLLHSDSQQETSRNPQVRRIQKTETAPVTLTDMHLPLPFVEAHRRDKFCEDILLSARMYEPAYPVKVLAPAFLLFGFLYEIHAATDIHNPLPYLDKHGKRVSPFPHAVASSPYLILTLRNLRVFHAAQKVPGHAILRVTDLTACRRLFDEELEKLRKAIVQNLL
ncbi:hypothetical protein JCM11641_001439 [Rhodosporidiobolus odoratus]